MEYININGRYYECTEELYFYIRQLDSELIFYKLGYKKVLKTNELLSKKIKRYYTLAHVYKIELGRCVRKLTRIYQNIRKYAYLNYVFKDGQPKPNEVVKFFKEL